MSHEARLSRLGLSHLADKPEELSRELNRRAAEIKEREKVASAKLEARRKELESMTPEQREKEEAAIRERLREKFAQM
jgi:hypothetical protein